MKWDGKSKGANGGPWVVSQETGFVFFFFFLLRKGKARIILCRR